MRAHGKLQLECTALRHSLPDLQLLLVVFDEVDYLALLSNVGGNSNFVVLIRTTAELRR